MAGIFAGVVLWTSLPPLSWWWAAPFGVALVAVVAASLRPRAAVGFGYAVGLGQLVPTFAFLRGLGVDAWLVVSVIESLWFALLALAFALVGRRRWWPVAVPFVWVAVEFVRDRWPFGGLPWGRLAFGQADGPLLNWAAVAGAPGVTFAVCTLGAALAALAVLSGRRLAPSRAPSPAVQPDAAPDRDAPAVHAPQGSPPAAAAHPTTPHASSPHSDAPHSDAPHTAAPHTAAPPPPTRRPAGHGLVARQPAGHRVLVAGLALAAAAVALFADRLVDIPTSGQSLHGPAHAVVAAVQGNVPRLGLAEFAQRRAVTANHAAETERLAADVAAGRRPKPDLVIWPENAVDDDPTTDPVARALVDGAVRSIGVPVLVGAVLDGPGPNHVRNAAVVWSPATGPGAIYVKRHLVPFGEYLPFREILTKLVSRFSLIAHDFAPGHSPGVLTVGPARIADVICYEVADDGVVRSAVDGGGRLLVVQTNNATYEHRGDDGRGGETAQQLEMSQLRAVEHGRAVIVAATSGVSAVIGPDGRVLQRSGVFTPALLVADVPLRDSRTLADRLGPWPERGMALVGLLMVLAGLQQWRRPDRTTTAAAGESAPPETPGPHKPTGSEPTVAVAAS